jgi:hypothetical protein
VVAGGCCCLRRESAFRHAGQQNRGGLPLEDRRNAEPELAHVPRAAKGNVDMPSDFIRFRPWLQRATTSYAFTRPSARVGVSSRRGEGWRSAALLAGRGTTPALIPSASERAGRIDFASPGECRRRSFSVLCGGGTARRRIVMPRDLEPEVPRPRRSTSRPSSPFQCDRERLVFLGGWRRGPERWVECRQRRRAAVDLTRSAPWKTVGEIDDILVSANAVVWDRQAVDGPTSENAC